MKRPRYWFNLLGVTILTVFLASLFLALYFTNRWTWTILHPSRNSPTGDSLVAQKIPFKKVKLTTRDGLELSAWYTPPKAGVVILVAHGYNDNRPENMYAMLAQHGYGVLAWDFRAHGDSEGEISTFGYNERMDVEAALDFALAQEGVEHVGAWGGSMGGATIILAAAERPEIEAVVADSAYPSLEDVLRLNMPIRLFQPFVMFWGGYYSGVEINEVRPVDVIGRISPRPVFIIDGWEGGAIAMNSPYRLYDAAQEPKQLWVEQGVPHLGMLGYAPKRYEDKIIDFFNECFFTP
ncbi:MAG: alpha/beta hydrolase [Anaerolineales bacterium]|nr:alpha/beta hydrolase [Anaerolineales bacterium]